MDWVLNGDEWRGDASADADVGVKTRLLWDVGASSQDSDVQVAAERYAIASFFMRSSAGICSLACCGQCRSFL